MQTEKIEYHDGEVLLEGYLAINKELTGKRPAILVMHDWSGRNEFACKRAEKLAELGYVGFAIDMFGKGKFGESKEEKTQLIKPFVEDRSLLRKRVLSGFECLKKQANVAVEQIGAIGFCFGGMCVLDLARSGADVKAVVSFHGLLGAPQNLPNNKMTAKILALHGHDDPMVPPDHVLAFENEMTRSNVDWQVHIYGNTKHAFTNPLANDPGFGTVYEKKADARSWITMKDFFVEVFGRGNVK